MTKAILFALVAPAAASKIVLEDFKSPAHAWTQSNDPVMGGQSTGTFVIGNGVGVFDGEVVDVPSLKAPGFIKVESDRREKVPFADVSSCDSFYLTLKSDTAYNGFRLSVDNVKVSGGFFLYGHKAPQFGADLELGSTTTVTFPFSSFSNAWDAATGDITESCADNAKLCLSKEILTDIGTIALWGEGVGGKVHLEVEEIGASGCRNEATSYQKALQKGLRGSKAATATAALRRTKPVLGEDLCSGEVQENLRYNMSVVNLDAVYDLPYATADGATLAEAICCDSAFEPYAEPQYLFERPDVNLFAEMQASEEFKQFGYVTFYDSVCGEPIYRAPMGRSMEDFMEDTVEHYWPSFRNAEIIEGATTVREGTDYIFSKCGTHLGSDLPEASPWGERRHCVDTTCVSGNAPVMLAMVK